MKKSDCGGLSVLFVAAMRSQGIPSRALVGRNATSATHGKHGDSREHVKAEFFAQGVGWVPVNVSMAVLFDKTTEKLEYFGNDKGDHLAFCVDTDVSIDTRYFGVKKITWLQSACFWATGPGNLDGDVDEEDWKVFALPPEHAPDKKGLGRAQPPVPRGALKTMAECQTIISPENVLLRSRSTCSRTLQG